MSAVRRGLLDVTESELSYLTPHFTENWSEALRDFATSHFLTLMSDPRTETMEPKAMAALAVQLTFGIAEDLGGTQPYIAAGANLKHEQRKAKALALLADGISYEVVAKKCGITASRVRNIEREIRRKKSKENKFAIPGWRDEAQQQTDAVASGSDSSTQPVRCATSQKSEFPAWSGL